ncbi:MAG: hypothetical protein CMJ31_05150 [Phycisphaerae bacterium]|nr:hypothetical protein [Phycisphaerae bacterium]
MAADYRSHARIRCTSMKAILFAVLAGLCWGVGELFTKSVLHTKQVGPITAIAVRSSVAIPLMWAAYAWAVHSAKLEPSKWTEASAGTLWKLVLGSGVIAGAGGMIFFYLSLHYGEISRVKPIAFALAPATAVTLGWLALGEPLGTRKIMGVGCILAGVALLSANAPR